MSTIKTHFSKYGALWEMGIDPLILELACIHKNGKWKNKKGEDCGLGLFQHFMNARKLLWPDRYRHRWTDLIYQEIINNQVTVLMGAASTQKTSHACEYVLIDYWANPENTLVLLSTTTREKLNLAVFGEIKKLFNAAKEEFPFLSGNLIDSKYCIATDDLESGETRDLRKGIIGRACYVGSKYVGLGCFPAGQMADTPNGLVPIENVKIGDTIIGALGPAKVKRHSIIPAKQLVRVTLNDGRKIDCTPEHPFFTESGWVNAVDLRSQTVLLSSHDTLQNLRDRNNRWSLSNEILFSDLQEKAMGEAVQVVPEDFHSIGNKGGFLRKNLQCNLENATAGNCVKNGGESKHIGHFQKLQGLVGRTSRTERSAEADHEENVSCLSLKNKTRKSFSGKLSNHSGGNDNEGFVSRSRNQFSGKNWEKLKMGENSSVVQDRFGLGGDKTWNRSGWLLSQFNGTKTEGCKEGLVSDKSRVVNVEILKQAGDSRYNESQGGYRVHNLEIEGHPSYSINGVLVHNSFAGIKQERIRFLADELQFMQPTFLDCLPNMFSNPDVKVIGSGNPKHDESDQLSMAACPKGGWDSIGRVEKTTCWDTKFENGRCVNLVGTDSPNFDVSENESPPYPRLVDRKFARRVAAFWGKDSLQYSTQIRGVMQIGMVGNRVVTAQLCQQHGASDLAFWSGTEKTKIYAIDLAYGGRFSDRCVAGPAQFGEDVNGAQVLCMTDPRVVPIVTTGGLPEDQIARWVQSDCEKKGIEPENIFYDSTGRGTMGSAFARIFGVRTPVPIEFGGKASPRPVRHDLFMDEAEGRKRLKRCDEHYSKFVSELWFSVRYVIECGQMRELPDEVIQELCMREYGMVSGNRIEVETKDDTKERMGCSPDKGDWSAIIVEGARQRGFKIQKMGLAKESEAAPDWFIEDAEKYQDLIKSRLLVHS